MCGRIDSNEFVYFMVREVTMAKELALAIIGVITILLIALLVYAPFVYIAAKIVKFVFF